MLNGAGGVGGSRGGGSQGLVLTGLLLDRSDALTAPAANPMPAGMTRPTISTRMTTKAMLDANAMVSDSSATGGRASASSQPRPDVRRQDATNKKLPAAATMSISVASIRDQSPSTGICSQGPLRAMTTAKDETAR